MVLNLQAAVCPWCLYDSNFVWQSVHMSVCGVCAENSKTVVLCSLKTPTLNATESTQILMA